MTTLNRTQFNRKTYFILYQVLAFVIPVHNLLVPPVIALIILNWFFELNFSEKINRLRNISVNRYFLPLFLLYLAYIIGVFYSSNLKGTSGAFFDLEVKLSLVLLPLLFITVDFSAVGKNVYKQILKAYVYGSLASSILLFNRAIMLYFKTNDETAFYYINLSWMHHPGYLALFYTFAIVVVLHWLINKKHQNILKRNIAIILIFHFELFIVLLSSKAGMIGLGLVYLMNVFFIMLSDRTKVKRAIIYSAVLVVSLMVILSFFPASYGRFYSAKRSIEDNKVPDNLKTEGSVARLMVWKCSLEIIAENLPFGVGTGDVKTELNKKYHAKDLQQAIRENLNSHNQYLQTTIATGLPGLILLIACLVLPVIFGLGRKQYLLFIFSVLFAFHLLVESMLERQAGVVFFAFFYGLFFHFLSAGKVKPVSYSDP